MIKSHQEVAEGIKSKITSTASGITMNEFSVNGGTDLEVHLNCVKAFSDSNKSLNDLKDIMEKDAKMIGDIAEHFNDTDEKLANQIETYAN